MTRLLIFIAALMLALLAAHQAFSHHGADWISTGGYLNEAGQSCCGEQDCLVIPNHEVRLTARGYVVRGELVPRALPSRDGQFWECVWGGKRQCFFAPPVGS